MITEKPLLLLKLQRKLYFNFPIRNMLQTNFSHAILVREGVMSRNRINHRLRTSMLDTLEIVSRNHFFQILHLHFMAKWRSPSFKYRRGFDLFANIVKIQQRTPRRCSYFRFVSFRLSNLSKPEKIPEIWSSLVLK